MSVAPRSLASRLPPGFAPLKNPGGEIIPVLQADYSSLSKYNISMRLVVRQSSSPPFNNFPYADPLAGIFCPRKKNVTADISFKIRG